MELDIVDKRRYPNALRAILYELTLRGNGGPLPMLVFMFSGLASFIAGLIWNIGQYYGIILGALVFCTPLLLSIVSYYSILSIGLDDFSIKIFGIIYRRGKIEDLIELHRLDIYGGCYRVRVKGPSFTSGFMIYWSNIPDPLKHLPIINVPSEP